MDEEAIAPGTPVRFVGLTGDMDEEDCLINGNTGVVLPNSAYDLDITVPPELHCIIRLDGDKMHGMSLPVKRSCLVPLVKDSLEYKVSTDLYTERER